MTDKQIITKSQMIMRIAELSANLEVKEQECEEKDKGIKFLLEKLDLSNNRRQDCEIHWEKERKELKQQLDQLKGVIKKYEECNKYLVEENGKTYTRLEYKFLKTLTEIKEIAGKIANYYDGDEYELMRKDAEQILQKISECEGNDETN